MTEAELTALETQITTNAAGPESASNGRESMRQHSLEQQIKMLKYLKGEIAASQPHFGVRRIRIEPPGTVDS